MIEKVPSFRPGLRAELDEVFIAGPLFDVLAFCRVSVVYVKFCNL